MVRFVIKRGPFLSLTWSVLSCGGPFCPWSVLSMVRYVPNSIFFSTDGNFSADSEYSRVLTRTSHFLSMVETHGMHLPQTLVENR